ncbi:MAG: riboflavin biosynthesis protein RibD, partial [Lentisphaeria bacterium]|nr:riboflavin biosynthesis protein RibD [Lentisphaeria bacterium]
MTEQQADIQFMQQAIRLARRGIGHVSPNPAVGAVIVRDGVVIGKGYHHRAGKPHAEVEAIRSLKDPD